MGLSKRQAEEKAVRMAKAFVSQHGGAQWTCGGAKPDINATEYKRRRDLARWTVIFDASVGGVISNGRLVVKVNLESGEAEFF